MNNPTALQCGFVGLGAMGLPMAGHLHKAGLLRAVWNRTTAKANEAGESLGVEAPQDLATLAASCNVIVTCVSADRDLLDVIAVIAAHAAPGTVVIDHSTVSPDAARSAAQQLQGSDIQFLDAPISGGVEGAIGGVLSIMVGGDAATLERMRPVLEAYGKRISHMGGVGSGQSAKAVNQVLIAGIAQAVCEGLALAQALDLDPKSLLPVLGGGAAGNWFLEKRGATMMADRFDVGFKLSLLHKDLKIARELARSVGADSAVVEKSLADYARLMAQGHGDDDVSALIRLKRAGSVQPQGARMQRFTDTDS